MADTAQRLHVLVSVAAPIEGVSIGTVGDSATVRIAFRPEATAPQRAAAQSVVDGFDWSQAAQDAWEDAQEADLAALRDQAAQAIADITTYLAGADSASAAQVRAEVKAIDQRQRAIIKALLRLVRRTWR